MTPLKFTTTVSLAASGGSTIGGFGAIATLTLGTIGGFGAVVNLNLGAIVKFGAVRAILVILNLGMILFDAACAIRVVFANTTAATTATAATIPTLFQSSDATCTCWNKEHGKEKSRCCSDDLHDDV